MFSVSEVYRNVVEEVIRKIRMGQHNIDEETIKTLQRNWESKLMHSGILTPKVEPSIVKSSTSTFEEAIDIKSLGGQPSNFYIPVSESWPASYIFKSVNGSIQSLSEFGKPLPFLPIKEEKKRFPHPIIESKKPNIENASPTQSPPLNSTSISEPEEKSSTPIKITTGKNKYKFFKTPKKKSSKKDPPTMTTSTNSNSNQTPNEKGVKRKNPLQLDGQSDLEDEEEEDQSPKESEQTQSKKRKIDDPKNQTKEDDEGELLNSEDDSPEIELPQTNNKIICQCEKVRRNKNNRKTHLKYGIMHINGRHFVFSKAILECDF